MRSEQLREEGTEALRRMKRNMEIRDSARMTAAAAAHTGDSKTAAEAIKEAFCSKPTAANYFRYSRAATDAAEMI